MAFARGRVIVGVTGTLVNLQALRVAVDVARARDTVLCAVHVWETGDDVESVYATAHKPEILPRLRLIEHAFDQALGECPGDVDVRTLVVEGRPWYRLTQLTEQNADLLVVGASRLPWWRRGLGPATDRKCIRQAHCPVLLVPPPPMVAQALAAPAPTAHECRPARHRTAR